MIGGEAGQGVQTMGLVLSRTMMREGLSVFADQDYESRVRGGHNFFRIRASDKDVQAVSESLDILLPLNQETIKLHSSEMNNDGVVVFDGDKTRADNPDKSHFLDVPLERLATEASSNKLTSNTVALGAATGLLDCDIDILSGVLREEFAKSGDKVTEDNVKAARAGYDYAREHRGNIPRQNIRQPGTARKMLLNGNEAIALGALAAGCKFVAGYPMTPTTSILEYIADKGRNLGVAVVQPEDEISAINMVIGAAYTGVRAMTATSGGGFCLMVEGLSLAGITETPVVVVLGQRPGPAIGLPTRTEQGELLFSLSAGHGEFPRAVLAPASVADAFWTTIRAFNLAEKYQIPVIVLTDHYLSASYNTIERFDLKKVKIERGQLLSEGEVNKLSDYRRYLITESGISPRAVPLQGNALVVTDSDEHSEEGHIIEDAETRKRMVLKRMRKLDGMKSDMGKPLVREKPDAEITLVGWGSTYGAMMEAAYLLEQEGVAANILHLNELWPFPAELVASALNKTARSIVIESNATGQLAHLIRGETGIKVAKSILKFDGRPISPGYIISELKREVS